MRNVRCCGRYSVSAMTIILKKRKRKESVCTQDRSVMLSSRENASRTPEHELREIGVSIWVRSVWLLTENEFFRGSHHVEGEGDLALSVGVLEVERTTYRTSY